MPYLRCDDCGAKALPIATRCPTCRTPFERRNGRGAAAALQACHGCDSLIERDADSCRWCGEPVHAGPSLPFLVGGAVLVAAGIAAFLVLSAPDDDVVVIPGSPAAAAPLAADESPATGAPPPTPVVAMADDGAGAASGGLDTATEPLSTEVEMPVSADAGADIDADAAITEDDLASGDDFAAVDESGWVRAIASTFVNVRSTPNAEGEVRGVIAENAVVFLGDARGAWRRIRSGDVAGWAWEPLFTVAREGS